jgi:Flp pilus assembly protein TadG
MVLVPTPSEFFDKEAEPPLSVTVARRVEPSRNFAVPVGVPETEGLTFAVKVTVSPYLAGFSEDVTVVVVFSWTFSSKGAELVDRKLPAPA